MKPTHLILIGFALALGGCGNDNQNQPQTDPYIQGLVSEGETIITANCLSCHSLSTATPGPHADAPALSAVLANYSEQALFDDFRTGIHVGHQDMPTFDLTVSQSDAVLAYLKSIRLPDTTTEREQD